MQRVIGAVGTSILLLVAGVGRSVAQSAPAAVPDAKSIVNKACDAAGGQSAFRKLGILSMDMTREEVTQTGKLTSDSMLVMVTTPGPVPGRLEMAGSQTIAADDGTGGWALVGGRPDQRPSTIHMVKRTITSQTFSLLLPFSLTWEGVVLKSVEPGSIAGKPVWRLEIEVDRSFFASPQMSRTWYIDIDQSSFSVVQAVCPATDLGKEVRADGMLITVPQRIKVGGVMLPAVEKAVGLDEAGNQKTHNRTKTVKYKLVSSAEAGALFPNPIPPDQRPKPPQMPAPGPGGGTR